MEETAKRPSLPYRIVRASLYQLRQLAKRIYRTLRPLFQLAMRPLHAAYRILHSLLKEVQRIVTHDPALEMAKALQVMRRHAPSMKDASDAHFAEFIQQWHATSDALKDAIYVAGKGNMESREEFEFGWGADSVQFAMDCIPAFHSVLKKYYRRKDELTLVDIGAGSGAGSNVFTLLHSGHHVFSKLSVEAVDQVDTRRRWVNLLYPKVTYTVGKLEKLPAKHWDFVYCSHVIEHTKDPRAFIDQLVRICKGFAIVYAPYNEVDRIAGHHSTITEKDFEGLKLESLNIQRSMAWRPLVESYQCILAVIDCREHPKKKVP